MTANLRLRMLPRYPANITATNGFEVDRNGVDLVFKPDYGQLGIVASVPDMNETFFQSWTRDIDAYNIIPFQSLVDNIGDVIIGPNLSAIGGLATAADTGIYYTDTGEAATYTITQFTRDFSASVDAAEAGVALELGSAAYSGTGDFATYAQGALADTALQPGDAATPSQGDLADTAVQPIDLAEVAPSITADTMLVDNAAGTARESKTFGQVRDLLDPLNGLAADGVTDDTAKFTALRAAYPKEELDLKGTFPLVTAVPTGPFKNGGFSVANYEGAAKAIIPTPDLIKANIVALYAGTAQALWAQDKCHEWDNVIYVFYIEGTQHSTSDPFKYVVCRRYQHGVFSAPERLFRFYDGIGRSSFSAGVTDGVQWVYLRNDSTLGQKLFARRLPQRYELTRCIDTTSGSPEFDIDFLDAGVVIGAVEGMKATFGNVGAVGGLSISGEYTVSFVNGNRIQFTHTANATSTVTNGGGTGGEGGIYFSLLFNETAFQEIQIGGGDVGAAIATAFNGGTAPVHLHSFAPLMPTSALVADDGSHLIGVSGGDVNVGIAKILRPMDTNGSVGGKTVAFVAQIPGGTNLSEPTVTSDGNVTSSKLRGFCRTQSDTAPSIFWTADLNGNVISNFQTWNMDIGANVQSPIPLVILGDDIFALCSATRYGKNNGTTGLKATPIDMYLLHAKKADADANGWAAFKRYVVTKSFFANHFFALNNGVGVGSLVKVDDSTIMAVFGIEATGENPSIGPSRIYAALIDVEALVGKQRTYPLLLPQVIDLDGGYWLYRGLPAIATGGYLTFTTPIAQVAPVIFDTATGYITPVEPCELEISIQVEYGAGTAGERYCVLVNDADVDQLGVKLAKAINLSTDAADFKVGVHTFRKQFRPGEKMRLKVVSPNGTRATSDSSSIYIRKV